MSEKLNEIIAGLSAEEKDKLVRGALQAMAGLGEEFDWSSDTLDKVAEALVPAKPADVPTFVDQDEDAENFWAQV